MTTRHTIVNVLLRLYPASWRNEYGVELTDILLAAPLTARVIADVAWSGLRQRVRAAEPSTILGLFSVAVILTGFVLTLGRYDRSWAAVLQPSSKLLPTVNVTFLVSEYFVLLLVACGYWAHLRDGRPVVRCGWAAVRMSLIAAIPIMLGGLLVAFGILDVTFLEPGVANTPRHTASGLAIITAPLFRLSESWIWGAIGGWLARQIARSRQTAAAE